MSKDMTDVCGIGPFHPQVVCRLSIGILKDNVHRKYSRATFAYFCIKTWQYSLETELPFS